MRTSPATSLIRLAFAAIACGAASPAPSRAADAAPPAPAARRELLVDSKTSRLTIETETVGLSSMFGHDHKFDARDFTGKISFVPGAPASATLELAVRGDTLTLLEDVSDDVHREIGAALREAVLETGKYPRIAFRSRGVAARRNEDGS
jgi:polyisoprenoid-binding protein YceI